MKTVAAAVAVEACYRLVTLLVGNMSAKTCCFADVQLAKLQRCLPQRHGVLQVSDVTLCAPVSASQLQLGLCGV
jgi:hypothetical protein